MKTVGVDIPVSADKERLGSNPLIYLMDHVSAKILIPLTCLMVPASVKMRNLEASLFKPNSPNRE